MIISNGFGFDFTKLIQLINADHMKSTAQKGKDSNHKYECVEELNLRGS